MVHIKKNLKKKANRTFKKFSNVDDVNVLIRGAHFDNHLIRELNFFPLGVYLEKTETLNSKRYTQPSVHSSTMFRSQNMEAT